MNIYIEKEDAEFIKSIPDKKPAQIISEYVRKDRQGELNPEPESIPSMENVRYG